jgi:hypothetical protein
MRFIRLFLAGYAILIAGIGLALWQTGVFHRLAATWIWAGALVAIGVGVMLSVASGKPAVSEQTRR